jgi:hypothetical protein
MTFSALRIFPITFGLALAANVNAGEGSGKITQIMPGATNGAVLFTTEIHSNKPACSTQGNEWALSVNTEGGRAMYAALLQAAATGQRIWVTGKNDCSVWGDREAPLWIIIKPQQ